ncbi:DUF4397 domain-containing protein [Colwellia sp. UCD-KL20]|uniref:DUF4397 domain-containing protein n=1 Tax=Colwellia sp. UCD-KL20 TaxID=1917165 RepID=UPI001177763A|nr:DUF4397 domain-containing protein [Colwellia sp. UCD-KL20]
MNFCNRVNMNVKQATALVFSAMLVLTGCGSDSKDEEKENSNNGFVKFYNASKDSPAMFFTVDEDLESSEKDKVETTFKNIEYTKANASYEVKANDYFYEVAWQNKDSSERENLKIIDEGSLTVKEKTMQLVVLSNSVASPQVNFYDIAIVDNTEDKENKQFNLRILNTHVDNEDIDVYLSKNDETFNEAQLIGEYSYTELSENKKFDQGSYIFYITKAGQTEVLFKSKEVTYEYPAQYTLVVRENIGAGTSPYALDKISNSFTEEYLDADAVAKFKAYNAIKTHTLLPDYQGKFDVAIRGVYQNEDIAELEQGQLSSALTLNNGDYSIDIKSTDNGGFLLRNHLLSLAENTYKTFFFYLTEKDIDTDDDGKVDDIEVKVNSLAVSNSTKDSLYDHSVSMVNLVDDTNFNQVNVYFVRDNETISTASLTRAVKYSEAESISLRNNTYQVFAIAEIDGSSAILSSFEMIMNEYSNDMFMVIETDVNSVSGYSVNLVEQTQ